MTLNTALRKLGQQLLGTVDVPSTFERKSGRATFQHRIEQEVKLRKEVDKACRQFARVGTLPGGSTEIGFFVLDRFAEASFCGRTLREFAHVEGPWLEWLLIDYWQMAGVLRWRSRLDHIRGE